VDSDINFPAWVIAQIIIIMVVFMCIKPIAQYWFAWFKSVPSTPFPDHVARDELSKLKNEINDMKREWEKMKRKQ